MKTPFHRLVLVTGLLAFVLPAASTMSYADVVYVKQAATGANDGSSWDEAYTHLQTGINNANPGDQVWVAAGDYSSSVPELSNCTVSGNSATNSGGAIFSQSSISRPILTNCIFWDNQGIGGRDGQVYGASATTSHCIIEGGFTGATAIIDADPLLLPLGDYGGPTQTMPIAGNSPAIAQALASAAPPTDQRDVARDGSPDIGAFEFQFGLNAPHITIRPDGMNDLLFQGIPGQTYRIERSTNMAAWTTISTLAASPTGRVAFTDEAPPPGSVFYRFAW